MVESTSDYWRPFVYLFEACGLTTWLVNARDVKQVPGRPKTDKIDAVWLAKLNERGMLRPSFIPPAEIRQLRDYTRLRYDLVSPPCRLAAASRMRENGVGRPPTPSFLWPSRPWFSLTQGSPWRVAHCCHEHAGQTSIFPPDPRAARTTRPRTS